MAVSGVRNSWDSVASISSLVVLSRSSVAIRPREASSAFERALISRILHWITFSEPTDLLELGHDVTDVLDKTEVPPQFDRSAVAMIRRNLLTLVRLINELLDITHIGKG